jgi:hypothetical protein
VYFFITCEGQSSTDIQAISIGSDEEEENLPHRTVQNMSKATSQTTKARDNTSAEVIEIDDEGTPKKKKKVSKPLVREAIKAKGGKLGQVRFVDSFLELK